MTDGRNDHCIPDPAGERWHLDKRIPVSLILTILVGAFTIGGVFTEQRSVAEQVDKNAEAIDDIRETIPKLRLLLEQLNGTLKSVDATVDDFNARLDRHDRRHSREDEQSRKRNN